MTVRGILVQALEECFREKIDESSYLFVKGETGNKLIGTTSNYPSIIQANGVVEPPEVLLSIEPKTIKGMTVITEKVTYWFRIENDNHFEICCGSNLIGRSSMILLQLTRTDYGNWVIKNGCPRAIIRKPIFVENDYEMYLKVFDLLADYGNPYNQDEARLTPCHQSDVYQINVENATLSVNGSVWFSFPDF